jgi:hypothetical protein
LARVDEGQWVLCDFLLKISQALITSSAPWVSECVTLQKLFLTSKFSYFQTHP